MKFPLALYLFGNNKDKLEKLNFIFRPLFASHSFQTIMMTQNSYFIFPHSFSLPPRSEYPFTKQTLRHMENTYKKYNRHFCRTANSNNVWRKDSLNIHWLGRRQYQYCYIHSPNFTFNPFNMSSVENIVPKCSDLLSWNNGKEVPRLDLTSSTTPGQQIHKYDHTRTANPCDWLPCRHAALPLVGCSHSLV